MSANPPGPRPAKSRRPTRATWAIIIAAVGILGIIIVSLAVATRGKIDQPITAATSTSPPSATATSTSDDGDTAGGSAVIEPTTKPTTAAAPKADTVALAVLATLPVRPESATTDYDRVPEFGAAWLDVDRNGCDTRDDILSRDLTKIVKQGACIVESGTLHDPYTGDTIAFTRGVRTSLAVQIDHVVPLGNAWETGASELTQDQRVSLANDPLNLLAVDGHNNESKGDKDASEWLPPSAGYACPYVARQVSVKAAYRLWVTRAEHDAMRRILRACPTQTITVSPYAPTPAPAAPGKPPASTKPAPATPTVVHPGAYCAPVGATGETSVGTAMVCGPTANSARARWHSRG